MSSQSIDFDPPRETSEDAAKRQLDALASGECDQATFLNAMKERFRFEPDENWEVLSLLDQYYRRGKISLEVFRAIKNGFAEFILGPQVGMPTLHNVAPGPVAGAPAAAAAPAHAVPVAASAPTVARTKPAAASVRTQAPAHTPTQAHTANHSHTPTQAHTANHSHTPTQAHTATQAHAPTQAQAPGHAHAPVPGYAPAPAQPAVAAPVMVPAPPWTASSLEASAATAAANTANAATAREVRTGDVLRDRYRIEGILATGASGTVFEASDAYRLNLPPLGKRLAMKVPRSPDPRGAAISQLRHEFHQLQNLSHPNIVRVFDLDRDAGLFFFTMELLNGVHLTQLLRSRQSQMLPRRYALAIIRDLGAALAYAHSRGIAHGDVNPQNVFITMAGEVRLLGFGAANKLSADSLPEFERASPAPDTPRYASCEVLDGNRPDAQDDIYSLSGVAYFLIAGRHPYLDGTAIEARARRTRPRRPSGLTHHQWRMLRAGLHTDARKRPSSVREWLNAVVTGDAAERLPGANDLLESTRGRGRWLPYAAAALLVLLLIGVGYWYMNGAGVPTLPPLTSETANEDLSPPPRVAPSVAPPPSTPLTTNSPPSVPSPASAPSTNASPPGGPRAVMTPPPRGSVTPPASVLPSDSTVRQGGIPAQAVGKTTPAVASAPTRVEMVVDTLDAAPGDAAVRVTVRRKGSLRGATSFTWWTESGTAKPGIDFSPVLPHVQQMQDGESSIVLAVPLIATTRAQSKGFYVGIESADGGAQIGARALTQITLPSTN